MLIASVLDPAWLAVIVPVALAVGGGIGRFFTLRGQARPHIVFQPLELVGPDASGPRPNYLYAVRVRLQNLGGVAYGPATTLIDPRDEVFAEVFTTTALLPGEQSADYVGIRLADQSQDPTDEQAHAFLQRCIFACTCWDRYRRMWVFFPFGGHRVRRREQGEFPWSSPFEMVGFLEGFPSRGERRRGLGIGEPPEATDQSHTPPLR